ncbi:MAG: OmpA family protein [Candidatus Coatesbacteria bacterium]|nr:OmpA family protein [Candidatus Coatesbacteria bacterium]
MAAEEKSKELPGWVPLFTSLIIILCAFFIMVVAYSSNDGKREKAAIGSVRAAFGVKSAFGIPSGPGLFPSDDSSPLIEDPRNTTEPMKTNSMAKKLHTFARFCESHKGIRVRYDSQGMRIDAAESVLFDRGSAKLKAGSEEFLTLVADIVLEGQSRALVEGHCDKADMDVTEYGSGWELTIKRAIAVTRFFMNAGVKPDRLASYGYGEFHPLSQGGSRADDFNRNVTILIEDENVKSALGEFEGKNGEKQEAIS